MLRKIRRILQCQKVIFKFTESSRSNVENVASVRKIAVATSLLDGEHECDNAQPLDQF